MKALIILSLLSVASAAETVAIIDPKTPDVHEYKYDDGNTHDQILFAPKKVVVRHSGTEETPFGPAHVHFWSSYYDSDGVTINDLKHIPCNLDPKFVEAIENSENNRMIENGGIEDKDEIVDETNDDMTEID